MRKLLILLVIGFLMPAVVLGQSSEDIFITGAWARATVAAPAQAMGHGQMGSAESTPEPMGEMGHMSSGGGVSAAYMLIENPGADDLRLTAASTVVADLVEIHEVTMQDDVMRMREVEGGIPIPVGSQVELRPGGYHVMLMDLTRDLVPGEAIGLKLVFEVVGADGALSGAVREVMLGVPILDEPPAESAFVIVDAWARPTVAAASTEGMHRGMQAETTPEPQPESHMGTGSAGGVSAAYMRIWNRGEATDRLVSAETMVSGLVEIHDVVMENDVMRMREVEGGIEIPAGEWVELRPGGYHVMLMDLKRDLVPGEAIPLKLVFESGAALVIGVPVYDMVMSMMDG